ncbi:MAG TPA: glycosyltransferase family 87 protein [Chloroflexota bacterium]
MTAGTLTAPRRKRTPGASRNELVRAAEHAIFGLVPVVATLALVAYQFKLHAVALDFHVAYYPAASRVLHGLSPYVATRQQIAGGTSFVYPALAALLLAPFALVSNGVAQVLYMLLCIACVPAILWTLRVRDWRLYGLAMLWFPVFDGWQSGNVTLPLALIIALAWRHRDHPLVAGLLTAVAISIKPFVWPLGLWLLATRRWKAAAWALGSGLVINLVSWWILGYDQISQYLHLSAKDTDALWKGGYSMLAVAHHLGLGRTAGEGLLLVASAVAAAGVLHAGLVKRDARQALVLTIVLMLVASPLLWAHYFSLLLIPLALRRPRLSVVWALPLLMWPMPPRQPVYGWEELLAWGVTATCIAATLAGSRRTAKRLRRSAVSTS